ncbi:MAG: hypothetical protein IJ737_04800 [Ruminococcus sp.]|nr:hypothetical protein [Ruminococcus sp.]
MKRFSDAITVSAFFTIIVMFAVSCIFFQNRLPFRKALSDNEELPETLTAYTHDNFPLGENWRSLYANLSLMTGRRDISGVYISKDRLIKLPEGKKDNTEENVAFINEFASSGDTPVYLMLAPTAAGIYSAELPVYLSGSSQREKINGIYMELDESITSIDAYYSIYSARDEYVFYRTENLWTSFGAYYAYCDSVRTLGFEPWTMENYDQEYVLSGFTGSLFERVPLGRIEQDRINIFRSKYQSPVTSVVFTDGDEERTSSSVYFRSALKSDRKTDVYILGDRYERTDIITSRTDAPSLLVIKGSYANTLMPFYTSHYSRITMIDPEKLKASGRSIYDELDPSDYDQILIMFDIESFCSSNSFGSLVEEDKGNTAQ